MQALRILLKCILLLQLVAVLQLALFIEFRPSRPDSYLAAAIDKEALLEKEGQNRILFAGGSNLAFGLDSSKIETRFGRDAINLGLHGSLGLCYMLKEVSDGARSGDVVIFIPEYEQFFGKVAYGPLGLEMLEVNPRALKLLNCWQQGFEVAKRIGTYNLGNIEEFPKAWLQRANTASRQPEQVVMHDTDLPIYARTAFNENGDMVRHLGRPSQDFWRDHIDRLKGEINAAAVARVKKTAKALRSRGIAFHVVFPAIPKSYWKVNRDLANRVAKHLESLSANTPESSVYEDSLFFDTNYHLNEQGREIRTRELGEILTPVLQIER
jgi:hypothetical protein